MIVKKLLCLLLVLAIALSMAACKPSPSSPEVIDQKIKYYIDSWQEEYGFTIDSYTYARNTRLGSLDQKNYDGVYSITIEWEDFGQLVDSDPEFVQKILEHWSERYSRRYSYRDKQYNSHSYRFDLDYVKSNGNTYEVYDNIGAVVLNGETVIESNYTAPDPSLFSSSSSSHDGTLCESCGKYYTDSTNKRYLSRTHLCKNCYLNYCRANDMTPSNYDD